MNAPVTEAELQAWVDGRLGPTRRAEVDAYLLLHPGDATRLHAYRGQNVALRKRYSPVLDESVPPVLLLPPRHRWWRRARQWAAAAPWRYAAMLALTLGAGAAGWLLRDARPGAPSPALAEVDGPALARRAALAHAVYSPERHHPVEVGADQQPHLVAWLSNRLGAPLRPPQLDALGYALEGGRLLPGQSGPVAQFMYQDGRGRRLTLYVSTEQRRERATAFRYARQGELGVFYWMDGRYGYALAGGLDKMALAKVADAVYAQLEPPR